MPPLICDLTYFLSYGDRRDFNSGIVDQGYRLNSRSSWLGIWHNILINLVHVRELMYVGEIDCDVDNVPQFEAGGLEHLDILKCRSCLGANAPCSQSVELIRTLLTGNVQSIARHDAVTERKSSSGERFTAFRSWL
jgi:hypothetical protein